MALIGTIRKQSGLLVIIVGVALAAFVLGDFLRPRSGRQQVNIAKVLGEEITYKQFDEKVEQSIETQKRNQNKESLTAEEIFNIKQQTYDQITQKILLDKEYMNLGIAVSADELFDQIQGENPHAYILQYFKDPETQKYDPELVRRYLKQLNEMDAASRTQWDVFVEAIKDDRLKTKYKNLISKAYIMPEKFIQMDFNEKKTSAKIRIVGVRYSTINDSLVKVKEEDFVKYYENYKQNYKQEASRDIDYVVFEVKPSANDKKAIREEVFKIFEAFRTAENIPLFINAESDKKYDSAFIKQGVLPPHIDTVLFNSPIGTFINPYVENDSWHMAKLLDVQARPDSMKATHILVSYKGALRADEKVTRTKEQAQKRADSLFNVVKGSAGLIDVLSKLVSDDPTAKDNSGDLGWFADGSMVYPFNQAVLEGNIGDFKVVESAFGYHVVKVTGKTTPIKKIRAAVIEIKINPSQETNQEVYAKASEFQGKAVDITSFDTLVTKMGLNKLTASYLQKMGNRIAGLDYPRGIIQWTFIEGIKVGSISQVFQMEDKYVVAMVTKLREKGIPELEEIKDVLEPLIIKELKGDFMVKKMNDIAASSSSIEQIAQKLNSKVDTLDNITFNTRSLGSYGNEANVTSKVFSLQPNVMSKAIKGNNAAFIVIIDNLTKPAETDDKNVFAKQLTGNFKSKVNNSSFAKTLEEKAGVTDNRYLFY